MVRRAGHGGPIGGEHRVCAAESVEHRFPLVEYAERLAHVELHGRVALDLVHHEFDLSLLPQLRGVLHLLVLLLQNVDVILECGEPVAALVVLIWLCCDGVYGVCDDYVYDV